MMPSTSEHVEEKNREQILAHREAKKLAKQIKKLKIDSKKVSSVTTDSSSIGHVENLPTKEGAAIVECNYSSEKCPNEDKQTIEKSKDRVKAERETKKLAKQSVKDGVSGDASQKPSNLESSKTVMRSKDKKPELSKAERRAIQESQRLAKAQSLQVKASGPSKVLPNLNSASADVTKLPPVKNSSNPKGNECKVKLFNHLECSKSDTNLMINNSTIHPNIIRLGEQYAKRTIIGSNSRCIAFLNTLKMVIQDFETPPKKEFIRTLETTIKNCVDHLQKCRPLAVSVINAHKCIKQVLTQISPDKPESDIKQNLCHFIETYIENQIGKAAQAISCSLQEKISNGDVILTFGCSSLINFILEEAHKRKVDFRVIVVDSRPFCEGQELLRRLSSKGIPCTYVLINAIGFVMPEAKKVLLGAHALLSNGYVMARTGTAQVTLVARTFNVPVLVCCETHKFSERFQTDAIVYNELGNPDDLVLSEKCCLTSWKKKGKMAPLNLIYDITPPELVTAVVTEVSILPCTSVPVILRLKPMEVGY